MILFVNNNSGILFIVITVVAEIWRELISLYSKITIILDGDSPIN